MPAVPVTEGLPVPCRQCPWRISNHGRPHPDGWYTKRNRQRLWSKLRRGDAMSCHPTDPANPVSDRAQAAGYEVAPAHAVRRECLGALVLQQREVQLFSDLGGWPEYRRARARGMTLAGLAEIIGRAVLGGTPLGGRAMPRPDLNAPVGHDGLPWEKAGSRGE